MAKQKAMGDYIAENDFLGAVDHLNSTNPTWKSRWYKVCETIFSNCREWAKEYILDPIAKAVHKLGSIKQFAPKVRKNDIQVSADCKIETNEDGTQKCYLIEFFNEDDISVCSKVGTTVRRIQERIREELHSKTYQSMGAVRCVIHRVYDCGNIPAEGLESYFRAKYIRKYPNSFQKNDRFMDTVFDLAEADKICTKYLATA